jgi:hypothetical protein
VNIFPTILAVIGLLLQSLSLFKQYSKKGTTPPENRTTQNTASENSTYTDNSFTGVFQDNHTEVNIINSFNQGSPQARSPNADVALYILVGSLAVVVLIDYIYTEYVERIFFITATILVLVITTTIAIAYFEKPKNGQLHAKMLLTKIIPLIGCLIAVALFRYPAFLPEVNDPNLSYFTQAVHNVTLSIGYTLAVIYVAAFLLDLFVNRVKNTLGQFLGKFVERINKVHADKVIRFLPLLSILFASGAIGAMFYLG